MAQRPRILLLIPHLGGGGAERVTALLTRGLPAAKYDLHLGLITASLCASELAPAGVKIHGLGAGRVRSAAVPLLSLVRRLRPDLILSGMAHLNFLVLLLRPFFPRKTRVVIRQNSTVSADLESGRLPGWTPLMYRVLYRGADRVVCQTRAMADDLEAHAGIRETQVRVLPNPIDAESIRHVRADCGSLWSGPGPHLLAIGRLSPEKGFDLLLEAFSPLRLQFPSADLTVLGSGSEITRLHRLRRELRLESAVTFAGYVERPEAYFAGATLFVLPSRSEGLPNAMLEAAAGGLPIVALPCSEGVTSLLRGKGGVWLAGAVSTRDLTGALLRALDDVRSGQRFRHAWSEDFHMKYAIRSYERVIDETLQSQ